MKYLAAYGALVLAYQIYLLILHFHRTPVRRKRGATPIEPVDPNEQWAAAVARAEMYRAQKAVRK